MTNFSSQTSANPAPQQIDVCNGDADGLCAVMQWRLANPARSELVTGLKRDIALLERVHAEAGDDVLVCDVSMQRNRPALLSLLRKGAHVIYFDHHAIDDDAPLHPELHAHLDFSPDTCTSLLVDRYLGGTQRAWALVGAYGDNLGAVADSLATASGIDSRQCAALRYLGEAINYNAYGEIESDVLITPSCLYRVLSLYPDPLDLIAKEAVVKKISDQRTADLDRARTYPPVLSDAVCRVWVLPDAPWSRRVGGSLANALSSEQPTRAHAVLRQTSAGDYVVSVRAPMQSPTGADRLCSRFGGTGRAAAAGIDHLPALAVESFVSAFHHLACENAGR